ncbi:hypothetical protein [Phormidesmis priestleyi]
MRLQTSLTLVSLLIASVTIGLHQIEYRLLGLTTANASSLIRATPTNELFCHRGSGRLEKNLNLKRAAFA